MVGVCCLDVDLRCVSGVVGVSCLDDNCLTYIVFVVWLACAVLMLTDVVFLVWLASAVLMFGTLRFWCGWRAMS
jgi:predicted transcriptional regulator